MESAYSVLLRRRRQSSETALSAPSNTSDNTADDSNSAVMEAEPSTSRRAPKRRRESKAKDANSAKKEAVPETFAAPEFYCLPLHEKMEPLELDELINNKKETNHADVEEENTDSGTEEIVYEEFIPSSEVVPHNGTANGVMTTWEDHDRTAPKELGKGELAFKWMISPYTAQAFYKDNLDKEPFVVHRNEPDYYGPLFSSKSFFAILDKNDFHYLKSNIKIARYVDGERELYESPEDILTSRVICDALTKGFSIQMMDPWKYELKLRMMCETLEEYFNTSVLVNMYWTPPNSQGFPPHNDPIDGFILQLEGQKEWNIYKPNDDISFPRHGQDVRGAIDLERGDYGEEVMKTVLKAGDFLYIPRGYVHEARAQKSPSLHITISTNNLNTWSDLLKTAFDETLDRLTTTDARYRQTLPRDLLNYGGTHHQYNLERFRCTPMDQPAALDCKLKFQRFLEEFRNSINWNEVIDSYAKNTMKTLLQPTLTSDELDRSGYFNHPEFRDGKMVQMMPLQFNTKVRLIRKNALRVVIDGEGAKIHHTFHNRAMSVDNPEAEFSAGGKFPEPELAFFDIDIGFVRGVTHLMQTYPELVEIGSLPMGESLNDYAKIQMCEALYAARLLMTENPRRKESSKLLK